MPLHRRLPKRGFSNARFKKEFAEINLGRLEVFEAGTIVTRRSWSAAGSSSACATGLKVLGRRRPHQGPHRARPQVLGPRDREDHGPGR
jgi:ribosomal protein L15